MATTISNIMNQINRQETEQVTTGLISSVGDGGNSINIVSDIENRGIVNASPYGFVSSPPVDLVGYVINGIGDENNGLVGVNDYNRPKTLSGGESALYTRFGQIVKLDKNGNIHLNTPTTGKAYYNGVEIGSGGGGEAEEQRVLGWIKKYAVTEYDDEYALHNLDDLLEERDLTTEAIEDLIDSKKEGWSTYVMGQVALNYVNLNSYNAKMAILDQAIGDLEISTSGVIEDLHNTKIFYNTTFISNEQLKKVIYGDATMEFPEVYQCVEVPTLLNFPAVDWDAEEYEDHEDELALVTQGNEVGTFYIFVQEDGIWKWRQATTSEVPTEYQGGYDGVIKSHLTTNYWTGATTQSAINVSKDNIMLVVNANKVATDTTLLQHTTALGNVNTQLLYQTEAISQHSSQISVLQTGISLKADQTDLVSVRDRTTAVETTTATHTSQIALVPSQITSTVTTAIENVKIGCRNLILNSQNDDYTDYYYDSEVSSSLLGELVLSEGALGG